MATQPNPNDRRFDIIKQRLLQQAGAGEQDAQEKAAREFARRGMSNSGAALKTGMQVQNQFAQQKQQAAETADMAKMQEDARLAEIESAKAFQREEREASQGFASEQAQKQMEFARAERLGGQEFQDSMATKAQGFQQGLFDKEMDYKNKATKIQKSQFAEQMAMAMKQFDLDEKVSNFNMDMANKQFNKRGLMDRLLDPFNVMGMSESGKTKWRGAEGVQEGGNDTGQALGGLFGY